MSFTGIVIGIVILLIICFFIGKRIEAKKQSAEFETEAKKQEQEINSQEDHSSPLISIEITIKQLSDSPERETKAEK